ncbi:Putative glycosyltransferase EpsE [Sporomusa silvacetica DSM 10669]|uniref:Glycosyltransferase EpsE n=1 Tax=Sporomusa silvacetica DSM 10669 TaxID=1123289 RepID=A0ABZ3IGZ9_9FIRM|nr:glycosyltransferase [Sporomusa silvacetica]OZC21441.1 putative glycosyltransferase EpsE [Sporomusa silvacetica DSM 10669]
MDKKTVSVIMGIYNCEATLKESIDSIINQTYTNWELVLCDDGSTDTTFKIAQQYASKYQGKIKLLKNEKNLGLAATLNHCLQYATGEYIARMDGDDISLPERFEKQVAFLSANPEYQVVGTQMISFDETGEKGIKYAVEKPDKSYLLYNTPFAHATIMMRRTAYEQLGGYRVHKEVTHCEDVDLWFRFYKAGFTGYNLQIPLYKVRESLKDFKRRKFLYSLNAAIVCYKGFKLLGYPAKDYIFLLKPIISGLIPSPIMKLYHNYRDG